MKNKLFRKCPICGSENVNYIYKQTFYKLNESPLYPEYDIVFCKNCGFIYANTPSTQEEYDLYYEICSKYQDLKSGGSGTNFYDLTRLKESTTFIKNFVDKNSKILDIGCGNGGLLNELKEEGYSNLSGLDPSNVCVSNIKSNEINAFHGTIFKNNIKEKFDCIILTHVLEHIKDLKEAVNIIESLLNDEGILYIESPNANLYKDSLIVPYYYFDYEHINHFDIISMSNLMNNFECLYSEEKLQKVNSNLKYPIFRLVFKKTNSVHNKLQYSEMSLISINKFLNFSEEYNNNQIIAKLVTSQEPVIVWGAGQYTLRLLSNTLLKDCNIHAFVDNDTNKQGKHINDIIIESKEILRDFNGKILISSAINSHDIVNELDSLNINNDFYIL